MKKTKILAILLYAVLAYSFVACSNSSGGSSDDKKESANNPATPAESGAGGGNEFTWPAFPSGALTVLPENTLGSAGLSDNTTITYVTFGLYPQTKKTDDITVSASTKTLNSWTVYAGSDNNYYIKDGAGYYKVEPIKWRILNPSAPDREKKILLAENILINCLYYDYYNVNRTVSDGTTPIYPNNYEHSRVRAFLNGLSYQIKESDSVTQEANNEFNGKGFLYTAFTVEERAAIADTSVVNNSESTNPFGNATLWNSGNNTYASDIPISDKIFLLSEAEVTKSAYGFAAYNDCDSTAQTYGTGNKRIRLTTDYAKYKGASQNTTAGYGGYWWLRSPGCDYRNSVHYVNDDGLAEHCSIADSSLYGVVPALCLNQ